MNLQIINNLRGCRLKFPRGLSFCFAVAMVSFSTHGETTYERDCAQLAAAQRADPERLRELLKLNWDYTMQQSPEFATEVGYPGLNDRWSDSSLEAIARRERELQAPLKVLQTISRTKLGALDQLNYDLFKRGIDQAIEGTHFHDEYQPLNQMGGVQQDSARMLEISPRATAASDSAVLLPGGSF